MMHHPRGKSLLAPNSCIALKKNKFPNLMGSSLKQTKNLLCSSNAGILKWGCLLLKWTSGNDWFRF